MSVSTFGVQADWVELPDDPVEFIETLEQRGWGDGLPVIPPTRRRVQEMLGQCEHSADEVLAIMEPGLGEVTAAKLAANAVMAGVPCEGFPVVLSTVAALVDSAFNLRAIQTTTHPVAPLLIVHGPIKEELGINSGAGAFGPGFRSNAALGRAVRLILLNVGRARPGVGDRSTQGQPSKFSYCIGENEAGSPWSEYHVSEAGLDVGESAVTIFGGENPHNVNDHVSIGAEGILDTMCTVMATMGANSTWYTHGEIFVVLGPEHAATIAGNGFTRSDTKNYLYENARLPIRQLRKGGMWGMEAWPKWIDLADDDIRPPLTRTPEDFRILVSGGDGKHSAVIPGFGATRSITRRVSRNFFSEPTGGVTHG